MRIYFSPDLLDDVRAILTDHISLVANPIKFSPLDRDLPAIIVEKPTRVKMNGNFLLPETDIFLDQHPGSTIELQTAFGRPFLKIEIASRSKVSNHPGDIARISFHDIKNEIISTGVLIQLRNLMREWEEIDSIDDRITRVPSSELLARVDALPISYNHLGSEFERILKYGHLSRWYKYAIDWDITHGIKPPQTHLPFNELMFDLFNGLDFIFQNLQSRVPRYRLDPSEFIMHSLDSNFGDGDNNKYFRHIINLYATEEMCLHEINMNASWEKDRYPYEHIREYLDFIFFRNPIASRFFNRSVIAMRETWEAIQHNDLSRTFADITR